MKTKTLSLSLALTLIAPEAHAGFRHPIEQTGAEATEIQKTTVVHTTQTSADVSYPKVAKTAPSKSGSLFSNFIQKIRDFTSGTKPEERAPAANAGSGANNTPIKLSELPQAPNLNIPQVVIPSREALILQDTNPNLRLKGRNRIQILNFAREAREMRLPKREYETEVRSKEIVTKYATALQIVPFRSIRTPLKLSLENTVKAKFPPSAVSYENMVKRLDALFAGLDLSYAPAVQSLWELSQFKQNPKPLQARDALFAGIIAEDAGWEITSRYLMEESVAKKIDGNGRYLKLLWNQLDRYSNLSMVDAVVEKVNLGQWSDIAPEGDKANYAMARRLQNKPSATLSADTVRLRIGSQALRDRISLLDNIADLTVANKKEQAVGNLRNLAVAGHSSVREESRLALARALMQGGSTLEALEFYKSITRTGKNKLEVLSEQVYAEYRAGLHQESLGKALGLQSPYFQYGFAPDIYLVEALNRKAMCDFGGAEQGLKNFMDQYGKEYVALQDLLARKPEPISFYEELISYHDIEQPRRFQRYLVRLTTVMENQKTLNQAVKEHQRLDQLGIKKFSGERPANWETFLAAVKNEWTIKSGKMKQESSSIALREAKYLADRLKQTFEQTELLDLDISTLASKNFNLQSALNFPVKKTETANTEIDKYHWPFEQEIWEDELDYLRTKNPSKCASVAAVN